MVSPHLLARRYNWFPGTYRTEIREETPGCRTRQLPQTEHDQRYRSIRSSTVGDRSGSRDLPRSQRRYPQER